ncbi:hypothetical protein JDV09_21260 [Mycobacterium sp. Y57]|uniref:hypothetical protein n=1 Tax=Mycolicibacterium xanthum TaxID=2796469 RepID=UPI001C84E76C|nr:hypothetical protein [Mycolicibacterium xanthum]MBX7434604.1 hypothetical protein [Mycolicibacterium xanthum]
MGTSELLDRVLDAHGGIDRWRAARTIHARARTGGLLLRTRVPGNRLADYHITVDVQHALTVMDPFPRDGRRGVFDGGAVRIEASDGSVLGSRSRPRDAFFGRAGLRRNIRWDALDSVYFGGYAMWNYLTTPYLLTRDGVVAVEGEPWTEAGETWHRLNVDFPPGIVTHSPRQTFYFDADGRLRRHDYVAEVIGGWARAAHRCTDHVEAGGLVFPTRRWVRPIGPGNRALPFPTLVSIELSELRVVTD